MLDMKMVNLEYDDVHLGVATSLDEGLMVPVINNADTKVLVL